MTGGEKSVYRIRNELSDTLEVSDNVQKKKKTGKIWHFDASDVIAN